MQTASKKIVNGWAMYDWANSVYNLVITTTFFPAYYAAVTQPGDSNDGVAGMRGVAHEVEHLASRNIDNRDAP